MTDRFLCGFWDGVVLSSETVILGRSIEAVEGLPSGRVGADSMKFRSLFVTTALGAVLLAHTASAAVVTPTPQLQSPTPGSTLAGTSATFAWSAGTNVSQYQLYIGNSVGAKDIFSSFAGIA